jgi:hypothetical protein
MRMKRIAGQLLMIAALAVMTEGVMPAPGSGGCGTCRGDVPNIHTYAEQSSNGTLFDLFRGWFEHLIPVLCPACDPSKI